MKGFMNSEKRPPAGPVAGGVGAVAGLATGLATGNPFAAGAAAGFFSSDVVKYSLGGGGSVQQTIVDTAVGGAFGGAAEALGPEVTGGQNFNPFTSPQTFGPKATQAYAQEGIGDALACLIHEN
jgi:hypothetical protein